MELHNDLNKEMYPIMGFSSSYYNSLVSYSCSSYSCARIEIIAGVRRITDVHNQDERLAVYRVCKHFEHDLGISILIQEKDSYTLNSTMLKSVKMLFTYYPHLLVCFFQHVGEKRR